MRCATDMPRPSRRGPPLLPVSARVARAGIRPPARPAAANVAIMSGEQLSVARWSLIYPAGVRLKTLIKTSIEPFLTTLEMVPARFYAEEPFGLVGSFKERLRVGQR